MSPVSEHNTTAYHADRWQLVPTNPLSNNIFSFYFLHTILNFLSDTSLNFCTPCFIHASFADSRFAHTSFAFRCFVHTKPSTLTAHNCRLPKYEHS